jgi:glycosyltransferase involved in cell wall biosynthesis
MLSRVPVTSDWEIRCCYFGTYRENYSRKQMMIAGLRMNGVSVIECHATLWHGIDDRVQTARGGWMKPAFWWHLLRIYWHLIQKFIKIDEFDILIVGYPGQLDVFLAKLLAWKSQKPLVWDIFMSIYLISIERGIERSNRLTTKLLHQLERMAVKIPDLLIIDTSEYRKWFTQSYKVNPNRFRLVPTGADNRIFHPGSDDKPQGDHFIVLYAGTFIPNHGVQYILEAAIILQDQTTILFKLIGKGPELEQAKQYTEQHQLKNVEFIEWMEKDELIKQINHADLCLGAFGTTPQSMMTVQNKIYETLAMRKPLISGDSPAIRQVCIHKENIYLCERASGRSLAEAIIILRADNLLRETIAVNGYKLFCEQYQLSKNGLRFKTHLIELLQ